MENKIKLSDKATISKIIYLTVIAILCVSSIVIGIVSANGRKKTEIPSDSGTGEESNQQTPSDNGGSENSGNGTSDEEVKKPPLKFVSPTAGTVIKSHSTTVPVFSATLDEWRIHTGLDISVEDNAAVYATADGEITNIYNDPMLGKTVEITHSDSQKSYYSNLSPESIIHSVGDKVECGEIIATVGDSSISELADETHLHFEMKVNGVSVNPLDYLDEESKLSSLGIESGSEL